MIRDRGRIKWTAMMLPEHVKVLREWSKEDSYAYRKELDEQQMEQMNRTISEAMETGSVLIVTHFAHHRYELVVGTIQHWDEWKKQLQMIDQFEEVHFINFVNIIDVQLG